MPADLLAESKPEDPACRDWGLGLTTHPFPSTGHWALMLSLAGNACTKARLPFIPLPPIPIQAPPLLLGGYFSFRWWHHRLPSESELSMDAGHIPSCPHTFRRAGVVHVKAQCWSQDQEMWARVGLPRGVHTCLRCSQGSTGLTHKNCSTTRRVYWPEHVSTGAGDFLSSILIFIQLNWMGRYLPTATSSIAWVYTSRLNEMAALVRAWHALCTCTIWILCTDTV